MTVIKFYTSGCMACRYIWNSSIGISTNTFGMTEEEAVAHIKEFTAMHAEESPFQCPICESFEVQYRDRYSPGSADIDPLHDEEDQRPTRGQIFDLKIEPLYYERDYWANASNVDLSLRKSQVRKLEERIAIWEHKLQTLFPKTT